MEKPKQINPVAINHSTEVKARENPVVKPVDTIQQQVRNEQNTVAQQALPSTQNKIDEQKFLQSGVKKKNIPSIVKANPVEIAQQQPVVHQKKTIDDNLQPNVTVKQITPQPVTQNNDVAIEAVPSNKNEQTETEYAPDENNTNNHGYKVYTAAYKELNTSDDDNSLHVGMLDLK